MILEILLILLGWWKVGGFDWITDVINCIFYIDYNYLETIANLITENDRLRDENNGLEEQLRFKKLDYTIVINFYYSGYFLLYFYTNQKICQHHPYQIYWIVFSLLSQLCSYHSYLIF